MLRRDHLAALAASALAHGQPAPAATKFQLACMALPYEAFPIGRALTGIQRAGYQQVAWGVTHRDNAAARRSREYIESVLRGLHAHTATTA